MAILTYRLTFRSPVHIGERGVGLEGTRLYVSADTLFSALCVSWRQLYGVGALGNDLLDWFTQSDGGSEPFFLSSAFPFVGNVRFFPKPLMRLTNVIISEHDEKAYKRVRFVSEGVFTAMVRGDTLTFRKKDCINGENVWVTEAERNQLSNWTDDATGDIVLWKVAVVPRVTLDRITSASQIWHFGEVLFVDGAGLWFAANFNPDHGDDLRRKFEACLRALGDTGLGGERSAGRGLFSVSGPSNESLPDVGDAANSFITLSPLCPKSEAEATTLTREGAAYELIPRRGWVTSPEASNLRRKMVWMFAEGSVLKGQPEPRAGRLVNVQPDACPHPVWRYGYAFPVGLQ